MSAARGPVERRGVAWRRRSRRVILVDEDAWCRGIADGLLRGRGYRVLCLGDPEAAVRMAREMMPDLIVADIGLALTEHVPMKMRRQTDAAPEKSLIRPQAGYALLRPLEADPDLVSWPLVCLKEAGEDGAPVDRQRLSVLDYVPKPFLPVTLLEKIERSLHVTSPSRERKLETATWNPGEVVMEGRIEFVGLPAILEMLHFNLLTGVCILRSGDGGMGEVVFKKGEIVGARTSDGCQGAEAVFRVIGWAGGRFEFSQVSPPESALNMDPFELLMLEGLRRLDEEQRCAGSPAPPGTPPALNSWSAQES
jgi:DNA-binding response OmpR family regulator